MKLMLDSTAHLPDHQRVLSALIARFENTAGVSGLFVSGSTARQSMDQYSDIDLGIVYESDESRELAWSDRWEGSLEPWFHRFDADHIKPYFVIYLFEPCVKADINFYTLADLPPCEGAPYEVVVSREDVLDDWCNRTNDEAVKIRESRPIVSSEDLIHDDERVWAWLVYASQHTLRGEYYSAAVSSGPLRHILEKWSALLHSKSRFEPRRIEHRYTEIELGPLTKLFPSPDLESLKNALIESIEIHQRQREQIGRRFNVTWKTSEQAIQKIHEIVDSIH